MTPGWLEACRGAQQLVVRASRPLILIGARAVEANAVSALESLAVQLGAALFATPDAASSVRRSEAYAGVCSLGGTRRSAAIAAASDVALVIGTPGGEFAGRGGKSFPQAKIIHVVDDPSDLGALGIPELTMVGELLAIAESLAALEVAPRARWFESIDVSAPDATTSSHDTGMDPHEAMAAIATAVPPHARVALDTTTATLVAVHDAPFAARRIWLAVERSAYMGTALGTALGIRLASGVPALSILGDWGLLMCLGELHTAARLGLSGFVVVAWTNGGGAMVRQGVATQNIRVPRELFSFASPDFATVARGLGIAGVTATSPSELHSEVSKAIAAQQPVLINAIIRPDAAIPGAGARFSVLDEAVKPR